MKFLVIYDIIYIENEREIKKFYIEREKSKMTKKEFFTEIANSEVAQELKDYAVAQLEKMAEAAEKSKTKRDSKSAQKALEMVPIRNALEKAVSTEPKTITELIEEAEVDVSGAMAHRLLKNAVEQGAILKAKKKQQIVYYID